MSEKNARKARQEARERGEVTVAPIREKGDQLWSQWPNRAARRAKAFAERRIRSRCDQRKVAFKARLRRQFA